MDPVRSLLRTSLIGFVLGILLLAGGMLRLVDGWSWFTAHGLVLTLGCVMPALAAGHAHTLKKLANTTFEAKKVKLASMLWLAGAIVVGFAALERGVATDIVGAIGFAVLAAGGTIWSIQVMKHAPKKGLTDIDRDVLTKGDDACLKHVHFSHRFLPIGLILLLVGAIVPGIWGVRIGLAAMHIVVVGYGLLSMYGISHFWVPRTSGIPAIAAGAIKGELHTSLLGIVGITAGFIVGANTSVGRGLLVGLGPMVFLGFFVWMGVLGANIMKNKSPTNSVRPEFVYIPWVFSAVFWAVTAVLMGIFLNALPDSMQDSFGALRFAHLHVGLLGGAIQLLLGLATRQIPMATGRQPPRFGTEMKLSFYLFNLGIAFAIYGRFQGLLDIWVAIGLATVLLSLVLYIRVMLPFLAPKNA